MPSRARSLAFLAVSLFLISVGNSQPLAPADRELALKQMKEGNYSQAYNGFSKLALTLGNDQRRVAEDFTNAVDCLYKLGRINEVDAFREKTVDLHKKNWRLLLSAADSMNRGPFYGFKVEGKFQRGPSRGGGDYVTCAARDRARAPQWLVQGSSLAEKDSDKIAVGHYFQVLAAALHRDSRQSWRLQYLTDLTELPDYGEESDVYGRRAPVNEEGNPIFYLTPTTWLAAMSDGERWRWALGRAGRSDPSLIPSLRRQWADFLSDQFGVETLAEYGWFFGRSGETDPAQKSTAGIWQVHTLAEDETIAKLAGGIKRFRLPADFNFIAIYKDLKAYDRLGEIFENRRQYATAADYWKKSLEAGNYWEKVKDKPFTYSTLPETRSQAFWRRWNELKRQTIPAWERLRQILGNWGEFEATATQAAGDGGAFDFRYRNGTQVHFEAQSINVERLLGDVKKYLKSLQPGPSALDHEKIAIENIGFRFVKESPEKYLGGKVASWDVSLDPRPGHFDRRVTVPLPFKQGGAFLVTSHMKEGNRSQIVLWRAEVALLQKPMEQATFYFVADARSGQPTPGATLNFFGYKTEYDRNSIGKARYRVETQELNESVDDSGQRILGADRLSLNYQWLVQARTKAGKMAYLGFNPIWFNRTEDDSFRQDKMFFITDRPVYRPGQTTKFKVWANTAAFDREGLSPFAGTRFSLIISNPAGENIFERQFTADNRGGFDGASALTEMAPFMLNKRDP